MDLGDTRLQRADLVVHPVAAAGAPVVIEVVGEDHALVGGQMTERESGLVGGDGRRQADGQAELDGELEIDVEELGPQGDGREVRREVGDVDAPGDGPFDLGAALAQHLFGVGVLPQVGDVPGEAGLAAEQRWGVGDRPEPVGLVLAVEREVHADVVGGQVAQRGVSSPRCRNHDRRARCQTLAKGTVDTDVGAVAGAEVVAGDDHQLGVVVVPEAFGE